MSFIEHSEPPEVDELKFDAHRKPPSLEGASWPATLVMDCEPGYRPLIPIEPLEPVAEDRSILAALESLKQDLFTLSEGLAHSDVHVRRGLDIAIREVLKLERRYGKV